MLRNWPGPHWVVQGWQKAASSVAEKAFAGHGVQMRSVLGEGGRNSYWPGRQTGLRGLQESWSPSS